LLRFAVRTQATKYTQKQLAYLAYWQQRGYTFGRNDVIPESTLIPPRQWYVSKWYDFAVTAVALVVIFSAIK
jgi:hypothetical protein